MLSANGRRPKVLVVYIVVKDKCPRVHDWFNVEDTRWFYPSLAFPHEEKKNES